MFVRFRWNTRCFATNIASAPEICKAAPPVPAASSHRVITLCEQLQQGMETGVGWTTTQIGWHARNAASQLRPLQNDRSASYALSCLFPFFIIVYNTGNLYLLPTRGHWLENYKLHSCFVHRGREMRLSLNRLIVTTILNVIARSNNT